jgi:hypothetical protein
MIDPERAVEFIWSNAAAFAQAKADRVHLEKYLNSKKALLMKDALVAGHTTTAGQEREALADPSYVKLIDDLRTAVYTEERLRYLITASEIKVDIWRTNEASNRRLDRAAQ